MKWLNRVFCGFLTFFDQGLYIHIFIIQLYSYAINNETPTVKKLSPPPLLPFPPLSLHPGAGLLVLLGYRHQFWRRQSTDVTGPLCKCLCYGLLVAAMPSTKEMNGCQVEWNLLVEPLIVYLIFSRWIWHMTLLSHWLYVGGRASFHLNSISRLASRQQKAIMFDWCTVKSTSAGATPNSDNSGDGSTVLAHILENVWKMDCQKLSRLGHVQNICKSMAGASLQRSQVGSKSGFMLDILALVQWSRCTI